ncbi:MAG: helix-turn-helix domain-containing protein [Chloroflexi bacterium]|nr:helix-turn-helix domain-containing protein [Chloroflexota bacterium]
MAELGKRLREARESKGLTLEQVEKLTHIRRPFLQALEEDRLDDLPDDVYARGFVRNYARFLGLEAEELVAAYRERKGLPNQDVPVVLNEPLLRVRPSIWSILFLALMIVLVIAVVGWYGYHRFWLGQEPRLPWISSPTPPLALPTTPPAGLPATAGSPSVESRPPLASATDTPTQQTEQGTTSVPPTSTSTRAAPIPPTQTPPPTPVVRPRTATPTLVERPTATPIQGVLVEARAVADTYILVTVDGERIAEKILKPGESDVWQGRQSVSLRIGNAAGIRLTVNGVDAGPLGNQGQVIDLLYTPDNLPAR